MNYPRMLYRPGTQALGVWNRHDCDLLIVESEAQEAAALADGWFVKPGEWEQVHDDKAAEAPPTPRPRGRPRKEVP